MTTEPSNWERFFDAHAPGYMDNCFTKDTLREVGFLEDALALRAGDSILDLGCGTGRHSIELARRGYAMTGLDLSEAMLDQARKAADQAGVSVRWVKANAAQFSFAEPFDHVIGLCEGSLGLLSQADDPIDQPLAILRNIAQSLKPGGRVLLTVLSASRHMRMYSDDDVRAGRYNPETLVETGTMAPRDGLPEIPTRERAFTAPELILMCRLAGLEAEHIWGGTAGNWGRRPIEMDEYEIMLVARKHART